MIEQHGTLEISRSRLLHNLQLLRQKLPPRVQICATVKANAYGHGLSTIAPLLLAAGCNRFCVYSFPEAFELCRLAPAAKPIFILVLAPFVASPGLHVLPEAQFASQYVGRSLRTTVNDRVAAEQVADIAARATQLMKTKIRLPVHVQIDTGLTRLGCSPAEAPALFDRILSLPGLYLEGVFTHLSHGDEPNHPTVAEQIARLHSVAEPLRRKQPQLMVHAQNSGGAFFHQDPNLDMVRIGIAMYGLQPSIKNPIPGLKPVARLTAPILAIHERPPNTGVGYSHTFTTTRPSRLAVVPVGYADGLPRIISNQLTVLVAAKDSAGKSRDFPCPSVGRLSMDQTIVDVTDAPAQVGDVVTLISNDPAMENSADRIAAAAGTIGYELATGFGPRLRRRVME